MRHLRSLIVLALLVGLTTPLGGCGGGIAALTMIGTPQVKLSAGESVEVKVFPARENPKFQQMASQVQEEFSQELKARGLKVVSGSAPIQIGVIAEEVGGQGYTLFSMTIIRNGRLVHNRRHLSSSRELADETLKHFWWPEQRVSR